MLHCSGNVCCVVVVSVENETDNDLDDFHVVPLNMRNGHSLDGLSPGSDLNEGTEAAASVRCLDSFLCDLSSL